MGQPIVCQRLDATRSAPDRRDLELRGGATNLVVTNISKFAVTTAAVAFNGHLFDLGALAAGQKIEKPLHSLPSRTLDEFLQANLPLAMSRAQQRRFAFGGEGSGRFDRNLDGAIVASIAERGGPNDDGSESFSSATGVDPQSRT